MAAATASAARPAPGRGQAASAVSPIAALKVAGSSGTAVAASATMNATVTVFADQSSPANASVAYGDTRRICQAEVALRAAGLGRQDGDLSRRGCGMVFQGVFWADFHRLYLSKENCTRLSEKAV